MKTSKEFFERIKTDEAFAKEIGEAVQAKRAAGAANYCETVIPVASEYGYEVSKEELDAIYEAQTAEMSEDELGKVAGGTSCFVLTATLLASGIIGVSLLVSEAQQE